MTAPRVLFKGVCDHPAWNAVADQPHQASVPTWFYWDLYSGLLALFGGKLGATARAVGNEGKPLDSYWGQI
jgi:hypothetical protein